MVAVDTTRVGIKPMVNVSGDGFKWGDSTVRGYADLSEYSWTSRYFSQVSSVLRSRTLDDYAAEFVKTSNNARVIMATEANGNLFWNIGSWVFANGALHHHFRERVNGQQTSLILHHNNSPMIGISDIPNFLAQTNYDAVSGQRLLADGRKLCITDRDPDTRRPLVCEFVGDMSVVSKIPFLSSVQLAIFLSNIRLLEEDVDTTGMSEYSKMIFDRDAHNFLSRSNEMSAVIRNVVNGKPISLKVTEKETVVREAMNSVGYSDDEYIYDRTSQTLTAKFMRSEFGHSITGLDDTGRTLLVFKLYTNNERQGLLIEEVLDAFTHSAAEIGHELRDAILMSSGGDLRIGLCEGSLPLRLLKRSSSGSNLLYKGAESYGVTSAFIFYERL